MKPQHFRDCRDPWRLRNVVFFTNRLKLVNSIPGLETQNLFLKKFRQACGNLTTSNKHGNQYLSSLHVYLHVQNLTVLSIPLRIFFTLLKVKSKDTTTATGEEPE